MQRNRRNYNHHQFLQKNLIELNQIIHAQTGSKYLISQFNFQAMISENKAASKIIVKLADFIRNIEQIFKKILSQKDIKHYLNQLKISSTSIIDNYNNCLIKFKNLLYQLKSTFCQDNSSNYSNQQSKISTNYSNLMPNTQNEKTINIDVLSLLLRYFEQHMIAQTHWSTQQKKLQDLPLTQIIFNFLKGFDCSTHSTPDASSLFEVQMTKKISSIFSEINKQQIMKNNRSLLQSVPNSSVALKSQIPQIHSNTSNFFGDIFNSKNIIRGSSGSKLSLNDQIITKKQQQIFIKPIQQTLQAVLKIDDLKSVDEMSIVQQIAFLFDLQSKLFVSSQFLQTAIYFQDDITTLPKHLYPQVWDFINQNQHGDIITINYQYKLMKKLMVITNASVLGELESSNSSNSWLSKIIFGLSFPKYFFDFETAKLCNHKFLRNPNVETIKSIWNLPQNGLIKKLTDPLVFDAIQQNIEFYVTRTSSHNLQKIKNRRFDNNQNIFISNKNSFKIRLLNYQKLDIGRKNNLEIFDTIIIHYHGGGFIALSSCTSQSYTRKWANALKIPVFSVDYGKPPEFRFPIPVLDCLDGYNFITTQIQKYFNIQPKNVFVAGDSAGGNLACSLTALTMKLGMKVPDGLLLAYPAVDTRKKFSPSRINSFNDVVLYPTLLLLCMQQYLGQASNDNNPLASPILLTEDYISQNGDLNWPRNWPRSIIMVGKKDPLYDDSIRLCEKLAKSKIQFHCQLYKKFSHAFLSIDKMLPECAQTIQDSIKFLKLLVSKQKINLKNLLFS